MSNPLISVIIPIYKVEQYLEFCVDSVLNQTFRDFELILVDDGSPDACPAICDSYAEREPRVKVIHKQNGGLSSARNAGIAYASGDYLCFIDSDDYISPVYLEHLYRAITETGADMAVCRMQRVLESKVPDEILYTAAELIKSYDALGYLFTERNVDMVIAPNKLYAKHIFADVRYPEGKLHEDEAVIHLLINQCTHVAWLEEPLYCYRQTDGSITTSKYSLKRLDELTAKESRLHFFREKRFDTYHDKLSLTYCSILMRHYRMVLYEISDPKERDGVLKDLFVKYCDMYSHISGKKMRTKTKVRYFLFRHFPRSVAKIEYRKYKGREE